MKRVAKTKKKQKIPHRFIPIVDAVVEVVFARLAEAAAKAKKGKRGSARGKPTEPLPESGGLAGAVADLLLEGLSREASKPESAERPPPRKRRTSSVRKARASKR